MTDPIATPSDVTTRLNVSLSDDEIQVFLEDATFDIGQATSIERMDNDLRKQLEWRLAGLRILTHPSGSRAVSQKSIGNASKTYETSSTAELREWIERNGPSGLVEDDEFWFASVQG